MTLLNEDRDSIISYRREKALQTLKEARDNANLGNWSLAVNRMYYAVFYMVMAINLKNGESTKTHSGAFSVFSKRYIANEILSRDEGSLYRLLFSMRQTGDYDDMFEWTENDIMPLIPKVESLISRLSELL